MISSLKEGSGLDNIDGSGAMALELEDLRHDKELQREEIQKLQGQVHTLRTEIQVRCCFEVFVFFLTLVWGYWDSWDVVDLIKL